MPLTRPSRLIAAVLTLSFVASTSALAGNIAITGHDDDFHGSPDALAQLGGMIAFARNGSSLPVLTFDHGSELTSRLTALGIPFTNVDPDVAVAVTDALFNRTIYSAFAIASDTTCGGCDNTTTSSTNIAAHSAAIAAFLNAGGGIVALAGANNPGYYSFLPETASAPAGAPPTGYFQTPQGATFGITAVNGDITHNRFTEPGTGGTSAAYLVAERLTNGADVNVPETLICVACRTSNGTLLSGGPRTLDGPFQIHYASNLTQGDSMVNILNTGANGASLFGPGFGGPAGNICVNVYAFSPDEQLISCCSCLVTPNGLVNVTANRDLVSNTLTGIRPNSIVIKLVATATGSKDGKRIYSGTSCTNSAALAGTDAFPVADGGLLAWGTTLHSNSAIDPPVAGTVFSITETAFRPATLDPTRINAEGDLNNELASIANRCKNIIGNGSTFGICRSCRLGGLGASKQ